MKKGAKIALCVLVVAVAAGGAAAAWQWNNINAARYGLTMDKDSISQRLEENQQALNDAMVKYNVTQYSFSQEEIEQLADGSLAPEEAARRLLDGGGAEPSGARRLPDAYAHSVHRRGYGGCGSGGGGDPRRDCHYVCAPLHLCGQAGGHRAGGH